MANRYWVGGTASWDGTAGTKWAATSGGAGGASVPTSADDVFFDVNSTGTVTIAVGNTGAKSLNCTGFAGTILGTTSLGVYGDVTFSPGMTLSWSSGLLSMGGSGVIVSSGQTLPQVYIVGESTVVTLGDDLTASSLYIQEGTFDANNYNVTVESVYSFNTFYRRTLKMGSGLWDITGSGICWYLAASNLNFYKGSANILLSNNTTSSRTFNGASFSYNKVTIGGVSASSTLTIDGVNTFAELASTKAVAHVINFTSPQTFGKWSVSGSLGNVVSLTGSGGHSIAGSAVSGVDYLSMGSVGLSSTSPAEFYAGPNSTGTVGAPVFFSSAPSPRTLYWVGGSGNWSNTARWSTSSGGSGGAPVPTSLDDVVFDSNSGFVPTSTIDVTSRCNKMTASVSMVLAGSANLNLHGDFSLTSGVSVTYTGNITLSGSTSGKVFSTNGVNLRSAVSVNGIDSGWSLGSSLFLLNSQPFSVVRGSISFGSNGLTAGYISSAFNGSRSIDFGSATISLNSLGLLFDNTENAAANLTVVAGSSQINLTRTSGSISFNGNGKTFYNVTIGTGTSQSISITGNNTFNNFVVNGSVSQSISITGNNVFANLTLDSINASVVRKILVSGDQEISGTLSCAASSGASGRTLLFSDVIGQARSVACSAASVSDVDFRDIAVGGLASPISGSRLGDCGGNSGVAFTSASVKYWNLASGGNWGANGWATSSGGTPSFGNFPLAQDTCIFESTGLNSGATVTVNQEYQIGSIDMSARTSNTMTLATGSFNVFVYGDWTNGTGSTVTGSTLNFGGRLSQQVTSAGKTFPHAVSIAAPNTSVILQDNFSAQQISLTASDVSLDANGNDVTLTGSLTATLSAQKTISIGSGTWNIGGSWLLAAPCSLSGNGVIRMTSASSKTFSGGGLSYGDVSLEQAGNGQLSIGGNNTFLNIQSSATGANTISMTSTTQYISGSWTARGSAGNLLTVSGGSLVKTTTGIAANVDYLNVVGNSASPANSWYAGPSSINTSSSGWLFVGAPSSANFFMFL